MLSMIFQTGVCERVPEVGPMLLPVIDLLAHRQTVSQAIHQREDLLNSQASQSVRAFETVLEGNDWDLSSTDDSERDYHDWLLGDEYFGEYTRPLPVLRPGSQ